MLEERPVYHLAKARAYRRTAANHPTIKVVKNGRWFLVDDNRFMEPEDIVEQGSEHEPRFTLPNWRPSRAAGILAAVTLLAGLAVGYSIGKQQGGHTSATAASASPRPTASATNPASPAFLVNPAYSSTVTIQTNTGQIITSFPLDGPTLTQNPGTCSVQVGQNLELGIQVTNQSPGLVLLQSVKPDLYGFKLLKVLSWQWGPCGFNPDGTPSTTATALLPGQTAWLTVTVKPLVACPAPAPVQFDVTYSANQQNSSVMLPGFSDLTGVSYSGCRGQN